MSGLTLTIYMVAFVIVADIGSSVELHVSCAVYMTVTMQHLKLHSVTTINTVILCATSSELILHHSQVHLHA